MKINVVIQPDPSDADAAGPVLQTLRDMASPTPPPTTAPRP